MVLSAVGRAVPTWRPGEGGVAVTQREFLRPGVSPPSAGEWPSDPRSVRGDAPPSPGTWSVAPSGRVGPRVLRPLRPKPKWSA